MLIHSIRAVFNGGTDETHTAGRQSVGLSVTRDLRLNVKTITYDIVTPYEPISFLLQFYHSTTIHRTLEQDLSDPTRQARPRQLALRHLVVRRPSET